MMRGTRMRKEMARTDSSCGAFCREIAPLVEIKRVKRTVVAVEHHLGVALKQQCERAPGGADIDRLPEPVQDQHMLV